MNEKTAMIQGHKQKSPSNKKRSSMNLFFTSKEGRLKYFFYFVAVKLAKKSDCPHFFLPILLQRKVKSTLMRQKKFLQAR